MAVVLVALFLVNLPLAHQTWTERELARSGREVEATVLDARRPAEDYLVDYRLPRSVDPAHTRFSARVDRTTYEQARETGVLAVRVVPGKPNTNRPLGSVQGHLLTVTAVLGDAALLLVGVLWWRRWRRRAGHQVVDVEGDEVTLESSRGRLRVAVPTGWARGVHPGDRVRGSLHLVTTEEVLPVAAPEGYGWEQVRGAEYVVRGRVLDARAGVVVLEVGDASPLRVETGGSRIRADIRDPTRVHGTLCFTPYGRG